MAIAALGARVLRQRKLCLAALQTYLVSCFVYLVKSLTKGIIQTINFVDHKFSSSSDSLRVSKISVDGL